MVLHVADLLGKAVLPDIPNEMPVFEVKAPLIGERRNAIQAISKHLGMDDLSVAEMDDSLHFFNKTGDIQYYRASGSIWARNGAADDKYENEIRPWQVEETSDESDKSVRILVLSRTQSEELVRRSQRIMDEANLTSEHAYLADVELEQIAEINAEGREVGSHAGEATVRFLYKLDGIPVDGGGAKTYFYFNPAEGSVSEADAVGVYHAWREVSDAKSVRMRTAEAALDVDLTRDEELNLYHERGYGIELTSIDLIYYALPPFEFQDVVFPAFRTVASVLGGNKRGFEVARYFHAVSADEFQKADLYADYLIGSL